MYYFQLRYIKARDQKYWFGQTGLISEPGTGSYRRSNSQRAKRQIRYSLLNTYDRTYYIYFLFNLTHTHLLVTIEIINFLFYMFY